MDENVYILALKFIPKIGNITAKKLIDLFPNLELLFSLSSIELQNQFALSPLLANTINKYKTIALQKAKSEIELSKENDVKILTIDSIYYPDKLKECIDAPIALFIKGELPDIDKSISFVGTRKASYYGKDVVEKLIQDISVVSPAIISGLAIGIDTFAHKAALDHNLPTIAVLGHGLATLYPPDNAKLAKEIINNHGCLMTEYFFNEPPLKQHFPERNRIIAGLSDGVVVVQTRDRGGALITANIAFSYNRSVFAVPGNITDPLAQGCLNLIKHYKAELITEGNDILKTLNWDLMPFNSQSTSAIPFPLNKDEEQIYQFLLNEGDSSIDHICNSLNIGIDIVSMALLNLEFANIIQSLPGKRYRIAKFINVD
jgi:DNA processing protein